ncbi:MAG: LppX_LprAFG lipoprotein [Thermomicrobiales bacterium]
MRSPFTRPLPIMLLALTLIASDLAAPSIATAQDEPDPAALLAQTSEVLAQTQTLRFTLTVDGDSYIDDLNQMRLIKADGALQRPGKVEVEFQIELFGAGNVSIKMITVDGKAYSTDLLTGKWGPAPAEFGYDPSLLFDTNGGLGPVVSKLTAVSVTGSEKVDGRDCWKVEGTADKASIDFISAGTMIGDSFHAVLWIDKDNGQLRKIVLAEPTNNGKEHPASWTMDLTDYNDTSINIEAPS